MKREDVKKQIPGITEEQLNWIMAENGNDVNREKTAAEQYKTQLDNTQAQLNTAQAVLAALELILGVSQLGLVLRGGSLFSVEIVVFLCYDPVHLLLGYA